MKTEDKARIPHDAQVATKSIALSGELVSKITGVSSYDTITLPKKSDIHLRFYRTNFSRFLESLSSIERKNWVELIDQHLSHAFPGLTSEQASSWVKLYNTEPTGNQERNLFIFTDNENNLIGTTLFEVQTPDSTMSQFRGAYLLLRTINPEFQGSGLGTYMAKEVIEKAQPDMLLTSCSQTAARDSWVNPVRRGQIPGYEAYPYYDTTNDRVMVLPKDLQTQARAVFEQIFTGVFDQDIARVSVDQVDSTMVRRDSLTGKVLFNHGAWRTHEVIEREGTNDTPDKMAEALQLTETDQVLVSLVRKPV